MKIKPISFMHGGMSIELVSETDVEYVLLKQAWKLGEMSTGNGDSTAPCGGSTGFYIRVFGGPPS